MYIYIITEYKIRKVTNSELYKLYHPETKQVIKTGAKRDMRKALKTIMKGGEIDTNLLNNVIQETYNQENPDNIGDYELD